MKEYFKRFQNVGTILALVGFIGMLLQQFGIKVDLEWLNSTFVIVCNILIILGIANNPDNTGLDIPKISKKDEEE